MLAIVSYEDALLGLILSKTLDNSDELDLLADVAALAASVRAAGHYLPEDIGEHAIK